MRTGIATVPIKFKRNSFEFPSIENIPSEPKVPLKNYLLDLVAKSDGKESSIYLKGVEKFIQEVWAKIIRNNWGMLKVREFIPKNLGISSISPYKRGRKGISIQNLYKLLCLWQKYCSENKEEVKKEWDEIYKSNFTLSSHKSSGTDLPKFISPKLSYLLGWLCGDGHIEDRWNHYLIKISEKSINQLNFVLKPLVKELFNINAPIFHIYEEGYALQIGNKAILRFLNQVLKIKPGQIPKITKNLDLVNKKYFLIGIFDSEGSVDSSYLDSRIVIHQAKHKFLKEVIDLFKDLNICFTGPYRHQTEKGVWYHIQIRKKNDILNYVREVGTCHVDKFQKIKILEEKLYAHGYRYNST